MVTLVMDLGERVFEDVLSGPYLGEALDRFRKQDVVLRWSYGPLLGLQSGPEQKATIIQPCFILPISLEMPRICRENIKGVQ